MDILDKRAIKLDRESNFLYKKNENEKAEYKIILKFIDKLKLVCKNKRLVYEHIF